MIWVIPYGKGRVFTTLMGHVSADNDTAIRCTGFKTVMLRGADWAATGKVTIPIRTTSRPRRRQRSACRNERGDIMIGM